jgi:hypothetical protein
MSRVESKSNLVRNLVVVTSFVALALVVFAVGGGDDRPPILVADGSIDISIQPGWFQVAGQFTDIGGGDGRHWKHDHPNAGPKSFSVVFTYGITSATCTNGKAYADITDIKATYSNTGGVIEISARSQGGNDDAFLDLPPGATRVNPALLHITDGSLLHVDLYNKKGDLIASCDRSVPPGPDRKFTFTFSQKQ